MDCREDAGGTIIVSMRSTEVDPRYLVPLAHAAWDGWFAIAIFPPGSPLRWLKAHFYNRSCAPGAYPLSLLEAIGDRSETLIIRASGNSVEYDAVPIEGTTIEASTEPLRIVAGDRFLLEGCWPSYRMSFTSGETGPRATFEFGAGWPIWWAKFGPLLQYVGQHSRVKCTLASGAKNETLDGFGVIEHVAGAAVPFDFTKTAPFGFHWDVLAFEPEGETFDSAAGLSISFAGRPVLPLKAGASLPGRRPSGARGLWVKYLEVDTADGVDGTRIMVPITWEGLIRGPRWTLRYEARAATPVAGILPGGGMLGFDFIGRLISPHSGRLLEGSGFTEYGDFSGRLATLPARKITS